MIKDKDLQVKLYEIILTWTIRYRFNGTSSSNSSTRGMSSEYHTTHSIQIVNCLLRNVCECTQFECYWVHSNCVHSQVRSVYYSLLKFGLVQSGPLWVLKSVTAKKLRRCYKASKICMMHKINVCYSQSCSLCERVSLTRDKLRSTSGLPREYWVVNLRVQHSWVRRCIKSVPYISYAHGFYTFPLLYSILQQFTKCLKNKTHCTKSLQPILDCFLQWQHNRVLYRM